MKRIGTPASRGMATVASLVIGAAILMTTAAIIQFIRVDFFQSAYRYKEDAGVELATVGLVRSMGELEGSTDLSSYDLNLSPTPIDDPSINANDADLDCGKILNPPGTTGGGTGEADANGFFCMKRKEKVMDSTGKILRGRYSVKVRPAVSANLLPSSYHFIVSAWVKDPNKTVVDSEKSAPVRKHGIVQIKNPGAYFAAINGECRIAKNVDLSAGIVYGTDLYFDYDATSVTKVKGADYYTGCFPTADGTFPKDKVVIGDAFYGGIPQKVDFRALTTLDDAYFDYYRQQAKAIAGAYTPTGTVLTIAAGEQYQPGCPGGSCPAGAVRNHIYFAEDGIDFKGDVIINGQILFVTPKTVTIGGDITKKNKTDTIQTNPSQFAPYGYPDPAASKAHQAGIIADRVEITGDWAAMRSKLTLEAFFMLADTIRKSDSFTPAGNLAIDFYGGINAGVNPGFGDIALDSNNRFYAYDASLGDPATSLPIRMEEIVQYILTEYHPH